MKIVSDFHDYYDSVMIHGQDSDITFVRKPLQYNIERNLDQYPKLIQNLAEITKRPNPGHKWFRNHIELSFKNKKSQYNIYPFRIIFCGEIYPGIKVTEYKINDENSINHFFYDLNEFICFTEENEILLKPGKYTRDSEFQKNRRSYFEGYSVDKNYLIENKVSIAIRAYKHIYINYNLKDFGFYKVMDAYSTFQTLNQWVSGTLAYPPNIMIEIEDKYRISAHGFDPKYGFRKRPNK